MRIAIDVMGGDNAPDSTIEGSLESIREINADIILVGKEKIIKNKIEKNRQDLHKINIVNADDIITNDDKPVQAIRKKKNASMAIGFELLKNGEVDALISAGNTGALLAGGLLKVGRIQGIDRPALAPIYPTKNGISLLIDAGANADCKAKNLVEFGIMGTLYLERVIGINNPRVGLVNIGTEEGKGNKLTIEAYELLKQSSLNFIGNVEARSLTEGIVDVIVCDGFVGNVILKSTEGVAMSLTSMLKEQLTKNLIRKVATMLLKDGLKDFKSKLDYTEYGGAPLLGIKKAVIKAHGSSNSKAIKNAIKYGEIFVKNNVIESIQDEIVKMGVDDIE